MKQTTFIALLLTFVMVIMVLVAAVVFLVQRNRNMIGETLAQEAEEATTADQSEQLNTDLAVRQAALESAEATRSALESQVTGDQQQIQDLEQELEENETALQKAGEDLQDLSVQLFIFSPKDNVEVKPLESVPLLIAARSDAGVESITIFVNDERVSQFPAEGLPTYTVPTHWTPPDEGQYTISAIAQDREGQSSPIQSVSIVAEYGSPEARSAILIQRTEADVQALRFPGGIEPFAEAETADLPLDQMHDQFPLLTMMGQTSIDPLTRQVLNLGLASSQDGQGSGDTFLFYYDPIDQALIRYESSSESEAFGRWVYVHDFAHQMMTDSPALKALDNSTLDSDTQLALSALIEGDANYLQHLYAQGDYLSEEGQAEIAGGLEAAAAETPSDLPGELSFIYVDGSRFIQTLYDTGGYPAVDKAWANPPQSSEQILHPNRFLEEDAPLTVSLPLTDTLPLANSDPEKTWQLVGEDVMGEYLLRQHLSAGLEAEQVDQAATGWGGGSYAHYRTNAGDDILVMRLAWDTPLDESEFSAAYSNYLSQIYGGTGTALPGGSQCWEDEDATCLYRQDGEILIIRAPDLGTVAEVLAAL